MGISLVSPLSCGTALQVLLSPQRGAIWWRLLRRADADFSGPDDPAALVVADRCTLGGLVDYGAGLTNGVAAFYRLYSTADGKTFADEGGGSGVPAASYVDATADPQEVMIDRMQAGLAVEVAAGNLVPAQNASGVVPIYTAPYSLPDKIFFPCVTVHLDDTSPSTRWIGDQATMEMLDESGNVVGTKGWMATFSLNVVGATLNPDERIMLRKAVRRIIQANLPIFDQAGMVEISFQQTDTEQLPDNGAAVYMTAGRFICQAPVAITDAVPPITDVLLTANPGTDPFNG